MERKSSSSKGTGGEERGKDKRATPMKRGMSATSTRQRHIEMKSAMGAVQGNAIHMDLDFSPRLKKRTILAVAALCAFVSLTAQTVLRKSAGRWPALICSTLAGLLAFAWVRYVLREKQYASKLKPPQGLADADSHFETINGIAVHYKYTDVPQSKLIMHCSHGFGSNCFTWQRCREQLAGENKAIVVSHDAPGFGITERPKKTDDFAMPVNAKIASALIEKFSGWGGDLASKKKVFVGHSMGSIAASMATLSRPSEAAALVLVAPALSAQPTQPSGRKRRSFIPIAGFRRFSLALLKPLLLFNLRNAVRRKGFWEKGLRLAWSDETKITAEVIDAYRYPSLAENWDEGLIKFTVAMSSFLSSKQTKAALLGEIIEAAEGGLPVLIIHGKEDRIVPLKNSLKLAEMIPGSELAVLENCGHVPMEETPGEFASEVKRFLDKCSTN